MAGRCQILKDQYFHLFYFFFLPLTSLKLMCKPKNVRTHTLFALFAFITFSSQSLPHSCNHGQPQKELPHVPARVGVRMFLMADLVDGLTTGCSSSGDVNRSISTSLTEHRRTHTQTALSASTLCLATLCGWSLVGGQSKSVAEKRFLLFQDLSSPRFKDSSWTCGSTALKIRRSIN